MLSYYVSNKILLTGIVGHSPGSGADLLAPVLKDPELKIIFL